MRKRVRKPLAFLMALLMTMSVFGSQVMAEGTPSSDAAVVTQGDEGAAGDAASAEAEGNDSGQSVQADNAKSAGQQGAGQTDTDAGNTTDTSEEEGKQDAGQTDAQSTDAQSADGQNPDVQSADSQDVDAQSADAQGSDGSSDQQVEYVPEEQPDGVSVKAYAAKGTLPEGAVMKVTMLDAEGETSDQYDEAAAAMEESDVDYAGFLAMDISFYDVDGNEIEPEDGAVNVQFEVDESLLPEDVEADSLAVQHLAETDDGIQVETVADAADQTDGNVAVENEAVKAEFEVERFSYFVLTYGSSEVAVHLIDENGQDILGGEDVKLGENIPVSGKWTSIEELAGDYISRAADNGYEFTKAYVDNWDKTEFKYLKTQKDKILGVTVTSLRYSDNPNGDGSAFWGEDIYMVFEKNDEGGGSGGGSQQPAEITPEHRKYVEANEDGTYDLTLTVKGGMDTTKELPMMDVVFVLDTSGSMDRNMDNNNGSSGERRRQANTAITTLANSLAENQEIDTRFSLVTFSGEKDWGKYNDADIDCSWTSSAQQLIYRLPPSSDGGTNYEAGLGKADDLLEQSRDGALKVVIFVSDGDPTYYYDNSGYTSGNGSSYDSTAMSHAKSVLGNMDMDYFFSVGVGPSGGYGNLSNLNSGVPQGTITRYYAGTNEEELKKAFDDIESEITYYRFSDVNITDTLSENVSIVENSDLIVTVLDKNGSVVKTGNGSVTLSSGEKSVTISAKTEGKQIILDFPDDYELEDGWTYQVTANIEATEAAYQAYRNNNNSYPDTGDVNTDAPDVSEDNYISSGKKGVYTNTEATLTYTYNKNKKTEEYPMPVIPLTPGTLVIQKTVTGLEEDSEALECLRNNLTFKYTVNGSEQTIQLSEFTLVNGIYTYTIKGLSPNASFKVEETNANILENQGYLLSADSDTISETGAVGKGENVTVSFTNKYEPENRTLTIEKIVGGNMGDTDKGFKFTLILKKAGISYGNALPYSKTTKDQSEASGTLNSSDNAYTIYLKDDEKIVLTVPYGYEYTIQEENGEYKTDVSVEGDENSSYETESATLKGTINNNVSATFTNTKNIDAPTGITRAVVPFAVMVIIALGAVVTFVVRRRIRR